MNARVAAADLLAAVEGGAALEDALARTPSFAALEGRDRAFARAMTTAALRRLGGLDAVITSFLERPLHESAAQARALLRIGAAQMLLMETPAHAAVGETVEAANAMRGGRPFAKLINAVLRRVSRDGAALLHAQAPGVDFPAWLFTRWRAAYGGETADAIAMALQNEPPLDLSVKDDAPEWEHRLHGAVTPTGNIRIDKASGVEALNGYGEGAWWVQDAAAALPVKLLGDARGQHVLDLCAAPGGKTMQVAAAGAHVTALDRSRERLGTLRENLARTQLSAEIVAADAASWKAPREYDAILLDAPCTATGTLRRHPDIAWLRRPDDVRKLAGIQAQLLAAARTMLKPGGVLVYAVCSLEPEEGPAVVEAALRDGWKRAGVSAGELPPEFITADGDMRTLPSHWSDIGGLDGFYAARLVKT